MEFVIPPQDLIFAAFDYCDLLKLKVVIIGQDPYHGDGEANGLAFSLSMMQLKSHHLYENI
jgi:uracil-DNA glycosylase